MKPALLILGQIICLLTVTILAENDGSDEYKGTVQNAFDVVKMKSPDITDETNITDWNVMSIGSNFNCPSLSIQSKAQTVHELKPSDIQVVAALGDSITAAMGAGASTIVGDLVEYRELSWSIGGHDDLSKVTTLPNIIKMYNPNVKGYSTKGFLIIRNANLNVAVSGAIAQDMPKQAEKLVEKIRSDKDIDFENDWKLVTLWIGGNNLCSCCKEDKIEKHSPKNYVENIEKALDTLHSLLPRTFVNLVQIIDVTRLAPLRSISCDILHAFLCSCAENGTYTSQASTNYQEKVNELVSSSKYNTKDDFTVVVQPFFIGVELPLNEKGEPDKTYFAPDCFHFSSKGHKEAAVGLWNNMLQPVGEKTTGWEVGGDINCPNQEHPYFYTEKNSDNSGFSATYNDQQEPNNKKSGHYTAIVTTSSIGVAFFAVLVIMAIVAPLLYRRRRQWRNPEEIQLLNS